MNGVTSAIFASGGTIPIGAMTAIKRGRGRPKNLLRRDRLAKCRYPGCDKAPARGQAYCSAAHAPCSHIPADLVTAESAGWHVPFWKSDIDEGLEPSIIPRNRPGVSQIAKDDPLYHGDQLAFPFPWPRTPRMLPRTEYLKQIRAPRFPSLALQLTQLVFFPEDLYQGLVFSVGDSFV